MTVEVTDIKNVVETSETEVDVISAAVQGPPGPPGGDMTGADIKTAYEAEANTNAFTDTEKTKLTGIEAGAEVNNISDANATDLTDGGETALHSHAGGGGGGSTLIAFHAYRSSGFQSLSSFTDLIFNAEHYDTNNAYNTSDGKYTIPEAGLYGFGGQLKVNGLNVDSEFYLNLYVNGSKVKSLAERRFVNSNSSTNNYIFGFYVEWNLAVNDVVNLNLFATDAPVPDVNGRNTYWFGRKLGTIS